MGQGSNSSIAVRAAWTGLWRRGEGRWAGLRWWLTLLLPVSLVLWAISLVVAPGDPDLLRIRVESQVTSERIPGASVVVGGVRYVSDNQGEIRIEPVPAGTTIVASVTGYETMEKVVPDGEGDMTLSLSGVLVVGSLADAVSARPISGAELTVLDDSGTPVAAARSDDAGNFIFKFIPEDAELLVRDDVYGDSQHVIGDHRSIVLFLDPPSVGGRVIDAEGHPISMADVTGQLVSTVTGKDGRFVIEGVGQGSEIRVSSGSVGAASVVVEGKDLGDIILPGDDAEPIATPQGSAG